MTDKEVLRAVAEGLSSCVVIYDRPSTKQTVEVYGAALACYAPDQIRKAFTRHVSDPDRGRFFPKPADLVFQINALRPNLEETAELAWVEVPRLLLNSRAAKSDDPITEKVIQDMGGWTSLGHKPQSELVWVQKAFVDRYQVYASHGLDAADRRQRLPGGEVLRLVTSVANGVDGK